MNQQQLRDLQWRLRARVGEIEKLPAPSLAQIEEKMQARDKIDAISATLRGESIPSHAQWAAAESGIK